MLKELTDKDISLDGDLLLYTKDGDPRATQSESEKELITVFASNNVLVTPRQIRDDLKLEEKSLRVLKLILRWLNFINQNWQRAALCNYAASGDFWA